MNYLPILKKVNTEYLTFLFTDELITNECLTKKEFIISEKYSTQRLQEFTTGRALAKKGLADFNCKDTQILKGSSGEPLWPMGFTGSISHCEGIVGAAIGKSDFIKSIGIDIEKIGRVTKDIWGSIFTKSEQNFLENLSREEQERYSTLLFSMKESVYKMQYPLSFEKIWFDDIEFNIEMNNIQLIRIRKLALPPPLDTLKINYELFESYVFSYCFLNHK